VDSAVRDKTHEMHRLACGLGFVHDCAQHFVLKEAPIVHRSRDARDLLTYDTPRADVEMSDLGIPHLPLGKAYGLTRCLKRCPGKRLEHGIQDRSVCSKDGIARIGSIETEPVHYHE